VRFGHVGAGWLARSARCWLMRSIGCGSGRSTPLPRYGRPVAIDMDWCTAVQHLRGLLVLVEILEPREEELAQLTRDVQAVLGRVIVPQDKILLARYVRWHLMPLGHRRAKQDSGFTLYQREHLRRKLEAARLFLGYLRSGGISLDVLTQAVVDRWLIRNRPRQAYARLFLLWAVTNGLAPAHVAIGTSARAGDLFCDHPLCQRPPRGRRGPCWSQ
jgi:hypothetical protein